MSSSPRASSRIGDLNGPWAILLKVGLALIPFALGWCVWATTSILAAQAFMSSAERFTQTDGRRLRDDVDARMHTIASPLQADIRDLRSSIDKMGTDVEWIRKSLETRRP